MSAGLRKLECGTMAEKDKEKRGKKKRKQHPKHLKSTLYTVGSSAVSRKGPFCPKCGPGVFMAQHKDRASCGKCGYTEFKRG